MEKYYVEYTYENCFADTICSRHYSKTKEEAENFIADLVSQNVVIISLYLITCEKII